MTERDDFATRLLEEAKRFLEKASEASDADAETAFLHAATMLGFCALEAHVNSIADDFVGMDGLSAHEKAVLLEQDVQMKDGEFVLVNRLKMVRLEERIEFLHRRFSGKPINGSESWWSELKAGLKLRNDLTHPKGAPVVSQNAVERALRAIISTLNVLYISIYKAKFPTLGMDLQSMLNF